MAKYKVWALHLCYNDPRIIEKSIRQYWATTSPDVETVHVFVDQHWPVDYPKFRQEIDKLAKECRGVVLDPGKNLGLARGHHWALSQLAIPDNAAICCYDPDSWPTTQNWDERMADVFVSNEKIAWVSAWHYHSDREMLTENKGIDLGGGVYQVKTPVMNSVSFMRRGWIRKTGGITEVNPLYGGCEVHTWSRLEDWKWVFVRDCVETVFPYPELICTEYRDWKWATAVLGEPQIEFGDWLKKKGLS